MIGLLAMMAAATTNGVAFETGNSLLRDCQGSPSDQSFCLGYVAGAADAFGYNGGQNNLICVPASVPKGQAQDIVTKYLVDHPEQRHYLAGGLVLIALRQAFPC